MALIFHPSLILFSDHLPNTADVFAGLSYLSQHPRVRSDAISILGVSYGAMIAVLAAYDQMRRIFCADDHLRFAGHISYYGCSVPRLNDPTTTGAPVLILLAEFDSNVSIPSTRDIIDDLRHGGSEAELIVFKDTYHQWDGPERHKYHVALSLKPCLLCIDQQNKIIDERTGRFISGPVSRFFYLLRNVSWRGYDMLRDEEKAQRSDEILFSFLKKVFQC